MSFIQKTNSIPVNIKLTNAGREKLSSGDFNVTHFSIGDTEIDYRFYKNNTIDPSTSNTLLPFENLKDIRYKVKRSFNDTEFNYSVNLTPNNRDVINNINMGYFTGNNIYGMNFNTELDIVKESNLKIDISSLNTDTNIVTLIKDEEYTTGNGVEIGDYFLIKWTNPYINGNSNNINSEITTPYLFYKILSLSGTIAGDNLQLTLDREVPNFNTGITTSTFYANCLIYPKYNSIIDYYGSEFLSDYWIFTDDNFIENCFNADNKVKVWNYTLFYPKDYIGITENEKLPNNLYSYKYASFLNYISADNVDSVYGIVHYTNSIPDNNIGESFYQDSAELWLPTIMWHKNKDNKLGVRFYCENIINNIESNGLRYYNLIDENNYVVGKCFPELKIFLIEDQELVKVLAFKSNRNWTLPQPKIGISGLNC